RIALAGNPVELDKVRADLVAAYGELPEPTERLLRLAQLRTGARAAGVRLISVREPDVILRTSDPAATAAALGGAPGKVTTLPPPSPGQLAEVYFRPDSPATLQGPTLLAILGRRFSPSGPATAPSPVQRTGPTPAAAAPS